MKPIIGNTVLIMKKSLGHQNCTTKKGSKSLRAYKGFQKGTKSSQQKMHSNLLPTKLEKKAEDDEAKRSHQIDVKAETRNDAFFDHVEQLCPLYEQLSQELGYP